jgi:hypothetical protein
MRWFIQPEDGSDTCLQSVGWFSTDYTVLCIRRQYSLNWKMFEAISINFNRIHILTPMYLTCLLRRFIQSKYVLPRTKYYIILADIYLFHLIKRETNTLVNRLCSNLNLSCTQCGGNGLLTVGHVNSTSSQWIHYWSVRLQPMLLGHPAAATQYHITTRLYIIRHIQGLLVDVAEKRVRINWSPTSEGVEIHEEIDD